MLAKGKITSFVNTTVRIHFGESSTVRKAIINRWLQ